MRALNPSGFSGPCGGAPLEPGTEDSLPAPLHPRIRLSLAIGGGSGGACLKPRGLSLALEAAVGGSAAPEAKSRHSFQTLELP